MNLRKMVCMSMLMASSSISLAFNNNDEQIAHILTVVETGTQQQKEEVLERLQWSTLSDPKLYDEFEKDLLQHYQQKYFEDDLADLLAYEVRALGYSGNPKYKQILETLAKDANNSSLKRYAKKAQKDLPTFIKVQQALSNVSISRADMASELVNYMRLLETDDSYSQRLAARAIYHEQQNKPELIALAAEKLKANYMKSDLDGLGQDSAAWLCKVLKQHGGYDALLEEVANNSPHRKIQRYAK